MVYIESSTVVHLWSLDPVFTQICKSDCKARIKGTVSRIEKVLDSYTVLKILRTNQERIRHGSTLSQRCGNCFKCKRQKLQITVMLAGLKITLHVLFVLKLRYGVFGIDIHLISFIILLSLWLTLAHEIYVQG